MNFKLNTPRETQSELSPILGILGGMGPNATAAFYSRLIASVQAETDQDHIPTIIVSDPLIPDRAEALRTGEMAPVFEGLMRGIRRLEAAGATAFAMPCNTAHHWQNQLCAQTGMKMLSIIDASVEETSRRAEQESRTLVLGTLATMTSGIYNKPLVEHGFEMALCTKEEMEISEKVIRLVKAGQISQASNLFNQLLESVMGKTDYVILACTELPLACSTLKVDQSRLIDTTAALATSCSTWWRNRYGERKIRDL